ncbi:oligosaccharide flippase family protein [Stappia sp. F7233]|uniref:Oligosaccharide flippase family protein n=1 Tax=Stappia albiluteola TaxID=2758565 RepID=A0A839ADZ3_9HYPH|nr:oligosaccharide flippase family protein [Stappia albiluteola]MBA5777132.1 oligosaccharide flippase family protein [Stappia albiluteola]
MLMKVIAARNAPVMRFLASGIWISGLRVAGRGALFLATMLMARALSADEFGAVAFVLAYLMVASLVGSFGLEQMALVLIARLRGAGRRGELPMRCRSMLARRAWTLLIVPAGVTGLAVNVLHSPADLLAMFLISLGLSLLAVLSGALRGTDRPLASTIVQELPRGAALLIAALMIHAGLPHALFWWAVLGFLALFLIASLAVTAAAVRHEAKDAQQDTADGGGQAGEAVDMPAQTPFMLILFATNLYVWLVPLLLERLTDIAEVGAFNVAMQYPALVSFASTSLSILYMSRIPFLQQSGTLSKMRAELKAGSGLVLAMALPMIAALVFLGEPLLGLFGEEYRRTYAAMLVITAAQAVAISCGPAGYMLLLTGREKLNLAVMASTNAAGVVVAALLAPSFGHMAAAIGFLVANVSANLFMAFYCVRALAMNTTVSCLVWWPKEARHG